MSEVIWYYDEAEGGGVQKVAGLGSYVKAGDFHDMEADRDAQRLRADTAEAELKETKLRMQYNADTAHDLSSKLDTERMRADTAVGDANEAERKLAAAEQRIALMSKLLKRCIPVCRFKNSHTERDLIADINAALNPNPEAESDE